MGPELGIGDVGHVPRKQVLDAVNGRDRNVQRIGRGVCRKRSALDQTPRELRGLLRDLKQRKALEKRQAPIPSIRIPQAGFPNDRRKASCLRMRIATGRGNEDDCTVPGARCG